VERESLDLAVRFFKALADESRLRLVGILAHQERSVEELAAMLDLRAPTVSHHLARLRVIGLVTMRPEGTTHLYRLATEALRTMSRDLLTPERIGSLADDVEGEAWERKVLRDFFEGERLKEIPASRKKREVILRWLANRFEPGMRYPEREVNAIIKRHHPDSATLRRELIGYGWLQRENGVYWRPPGDGGA
jgi:DNA-binding transcriptional ArsR family regulator